MVLWVPTKYVSDHKRLCSLRWSIILWSTHIILVNWDTSDFPVPTQFWDEQLEDVLLITPYTQTSVHILHFNKKNIIMIVQHSSTTLSNLLVGIRLLACTVKSVLNGHLKIDKTKVLIVNGSLMKVESIAECSPWSILQYFWPPLRAFCNTFDLH